MFILNSIQSLNENCTKESLLPRAALKRKNFPSVSIIVHYLFKVVPS